MLRQTLYKKDSKAQSMIEYCVLIALVALGIILMRDFVYRSIFAHLRLWEQNANDTILEVRHLPPPGNPTLPPPMMMVHVTYKSGLGQEYWINFIDGSCPYIPWCDPPGSCPPEYTTSSCIYITRSCGHTPEPVMDVTRERWDEIMNTNNAHSLPVSFEVHLEPWFGGFACKHVEIHFTN